MADCPNDADLYVANERPHGNGGAVETTAPDVNPVLELISGDMERARSEAAHRAARERLIDTISPDELPSQPVGAVQRNQLGVVSRTVADLVDQAYAGKERLNAAWDEAANKASGTTVGEANKWLDMTTRTAKIMAQKSAEFNKYAILHFGSEGNSIKDNRLVSAFESIIPKTRGALQRFTAQMDGVIAQAEPLAKRSGYTTQDIMELAGHYANAEHMPERNAMLLTRWEAALQAERAKGAKADESKISELWTNIETLKAHLDDPTGGRGAGEEGGDVRVVSGGYTNGQAEALKLAILEKTGISQPEMEGISSGLRDVSNFITQDRIESGLVAPEVVATWPEFQNYVPIKTKVENTTGAVNNANIYNPGQYHAIEGTTVPPDSAFLNILHYARRAANEVGMQDAGIELAAAAKKASLDGRDAGLLMYDYSRLVQSKYSSNETHRARVSRLEENGGMVVDVPVTDIEGRDAGTKRMFITFNPDWNDSLTGLKGTDLNQALMGTVKTASSIQSMANLTSKYGQMFTRWNPAFAPVNTFRDLFERSFNMSGRDYFTDAGTKVSGSSMIGSYLFNAPRAGKMLFDALRGNAEPGSKAKQYWDEYVAAGLHQEYTRGMNPERRTLTDILDAKPEGPRNWLESNIGERNLAGIKQRLDGVNQGRKEVVSAINKWNDYFNNIASFNHFMTLKEAGVSQRSATTGTLEMMNLYQGGTWTPFLRTLFPFVTPTVQSGVAMARTFGFAPGADGKFRMNARGAATLLGSVAGYTMLMPLIREGMGVDPETGKNRFDQMGISELQRFVPVGIGNDGDFFKMPTGFGPVQLAITLAVGQDRVQRGLMAPEDLAAEALFTIGKNVAPGDFPEFSAKAQPLEWLQHALTPTILKPVMLDTDYRGRPITEARADGFRPKADQGRMSTQRVYHQMAKSIQSSTGVDLAPEQVKNLSGNILIGPFRLIRSMMEDSTADSGGGLRTGGTRESAADKLHPVAQAMGASLLYGRTNDTGRALYYQALNDAKTQIRAKGVDVQSREYGTDVAKREAYQTAQLQQGGFDQKFIDDFLLMMRTETAIRRGSSKFNQELRPLWLSADSVDEVRPAFETLAKSNADLYNNAVENLNFFAGAK